MPAAEFLTEVCAESPEAAAQAWIIGRSAVSEEDADQCEFTYQLPAEEQEAGGDEEKAKSAGAVEKGCVASCSKYLRVASSE